MDRAPRRLDAPLASRYAALALAGVRREWPHAYQHLANAPADLRSPRRMHPAFYGCYDWHSAVHGHWALVRIRRLFPDLAAAGKIASALDRHLTPGNIRAEADYFSAPGRESFERAYGWAWLLALAAELRAAGDSRSRRWARALRPLERLVAGRFAAWLPLLRHPVRTGTHGCTAFAMAMALDYARASGNRRLERLVVSRSRDFYLGDVAAPGAWEPGGEDFLSPVLAEADLMRRVLPAGSFAPWWRRFLPRLPPSLRVPADPGPLRDGKSIHLDGLNLSRAWAYCGIASALRGPGPERDRLRRLAETHAAAGLARVASGDYLGEHWLASFALYLLSAPGWDRRARPAAALRA